MAVPEWLIGSWAGNRSSYSGADGSRVRRDDQKRKCLDKRDQYDKALEISTFRNC